MSCLQSSFEIRQPGFSAYERHFPFFENEIYPGKCGKGVGDIRVSDEDTTNQCRELHGRVRREGAYADVRQLREVYC